MKEMPGYCCSLQRCKVPKRDWLTVPPCDSCEKATDLTAMVCDDAAFLGAQTQGAAMGERLRKLMTDGEWPERILTALCQRAAEGDLKAIQYVLELLGEKPGEDPGPVYRIELGPGVEEMAK